MVNVSKKKLKKDVQEKLLKQLAKVLSKSSTAQTTMLLEAFLTSKEQVMLTKRIAVILMFQNEYTPYEIWRTLHMSPTTVSNMKKEYDAGRYEDVVKVFGKSKKEKEQFWLMIGLISRGGMPSMGKDRWKSLGV